MTLILALDLGTTVGWACGKSAALKDPCDSGTICFKPQRYEGGGMRFLRFSRWLSEIYALQHFAEVVFEEVRRHAATDAAHVYGGFMAHLTAWCESRKIPYAGVPVGTIKKFATGKGNADKGMMIAAAKVWGFDPKDDNEADAIALLKCRLADVK